jgi:hypothetical protein
MDRTSNAASCVDLLQAIHKLFFLSFFLSLLEGLIKREPRGHDYSGARKKYRSFMAAIESRAYPRFIAFFLSTKVGLSAQRKYSRNARKNKIGL